jgi:hypothetical protein
MERKKLDIAPDGTSVRIDALRSSNLASLAQPSDDARRSDGIAPSRPSQMPSSARRVRTRSLPLALSALLACAIALLLCGPISAFAKSSRGACSATAGGRAAHGDRACAAHRSRTHKRHKAKRHAKHRKAKQGAQSQQGAPTSTVPAQEPATCEDGSSPTRAADGSYACGDGAEPECADGSEPIVAPRRGQLLCPAAGSGVEWSEATCSDGSMPTPTSSGEYACDDGSTPECEDGSTPIAPDEGSQLACIESDSTGSFSSSASVPAEEESEGAEDADGFSGTRSATAS